MQKYLTSIEQACATSVYDTVSVELEGNGGLHLEGASIAEHSCPMICFLVHGGIQSTPGQGSEIGASDLSLEPVRYL